MKRSDLPIASPCEQDWDTMTPAGRKRFCDTCQKHVQDLSAMTEAQAKGVLASPPAEGLCVRYLYDEVGNIMFGLVDPSLVPASSLVRAKRALATTAALAGIAATLSGCMGAPQPRPAVPRQMMMGEPAAQVSPTQPQPSAQSAPETPETPKK